MIPRGRSTADEDDGDGDASEDESKKVTAPFVKASKGGKGGNQDDC